MAPVTRTGISAIAIIVIVGMIVLANVASAHAATSYVFEPTLSLIGKCAKPTLLDPVEDPGCPGGTHPPSGAFRAPSVTTDEYGDIYVANVAEKEGRIDVFDPNGNFITELKDPTGPQSIAVDSKGNLYVFERLAGGERQIRRFSPTAYEPLKGEIEYATAPAVIVDESTKPLFFLGASTALAVDPVNDRLYVDAGAAVWAFGSAAEENKLLESQLIKGLERSAAMAIDGQHRKIYLSDNTPDGSIVRIFNLESPHEELGKITGSTTPKGKFLTFEAYLEIDVDDATGHVFVGDVEAANKVYEFEEDGAYVATIEHSFVKVPFGEIAVDDGQFVPKARKGFLFVPSEPSGTGHVYAFEPKIEGPPRVESTSASGVTETDAVLHARINPEGLGTNYYLKYIPEQQFEEEGESFENAAVAGSGTISGGGAGVDVSAAATELEPGTSYRFVAIAENLKGKDEEEDTFKTFSPEEGPGLCPNEPVRTALSALLPDCRAYELVTPPNTNGRPPSGVGFTGVYFPTLEASPDGNRASFLIEGGLIPGNEGSGAFNGDLYLATRGDEGWATHITAPSGKEAVGPLPGSTSPDQIYSFWENTQEHAVYLRYPDGHSELVGQGSLGVQASVNAHQITENGDHVIFSTESFEAIQLEPDAPPAGTAAIYDRAAEGSTHVVSLLPENEPQKAGEDALYLGASDDGEGIAFEIGGSIYLRLHNTKTFKVAGPGASFAGVAASGTRVFYLEGGDLFAFDAEADETIEFSSSGDVTPVNVASDGTRAYFVSPSALTTEPNPNGEVAKEGKEGKQDLYLSEEGQISFVGQVTKRDVEGESTSAGPLGGLGLWTEAAELGKPAKDPSRATPSGSTLLFESRANLAGFDSKGFAEVYRYDATEGRLDCLSCSPTDMTPTSDASLQSVAQSQPSLVPFSSYAKIPNQSPDGKRAFFQTAEPLVLGDTDKLLDVYEWEEKGVGSCHKTGGCVYLISGRHSSSPDFLYAMSTNGDNVFFRTADILLPRDLENTLSIYDARVEGGFSEPEPEPECEGEGCHPQNPPPGLIAPARPAQGANDQVNEPKKKHCPKGKHAVRRHGKEVCVRNHHKKKHHRGTSAKRKGAS